MSDILFPPDLVPSTMMFGVDDFTAVDESATTGGMQSSALYGTRRWHLRMDFAVLSRKSGTLARFEALLAALRGRANRAWISPAQAAVRRGSFPAVEIFANNDFSAGTSSWAADSQYSLSALDHGVRATRAQATGRSAVLVQNIAAISTGTPYAMRFFVYSGKGQIASIVLSDFTQSEDLPPVNEISQGIGSAVYAPSVSGFHTVGLSDVSSNVMPGNFFDPKWSSFSRCAQVDNGVNLMLNSDTPGTGTGWATSAATVSSGAGTNPDGSAAVQAVFETTANAEHFVDQAFTVPAAAADYTFSAFVQGGNRQWCSLSIFEGTGSTFAAQWFNLSGAGALGSNSIGTNWAFVSARIVPYGNGWFRVILTARKTNAATFLSCSILSATADATFGFVGTASPAALFLWRASFAQSSVPVQPIQTAGTVQAGTSQTGYQLALKGLPASTQGLLLEGDVVECLMPVNSQLLRVTSRLDSDAAGLGTLIFENALKQSPVDGAGVVVQQPMGRFVLATSTLGIEYTPGVFGQASLEFVEAA